MSLPDREAARREAREIAAMLRDRAEDLATILLPDGRRDGKDWREGSRGARSIVIAGTNRGIYRDFENSDKATDMLGAVAVILFNGSLREAIAWAKQYLGYDGLDEAGLRRTREAAERRRQAAIEDRARLDRRRRAQARQIWHNAIALEDSPAAAYLAGRGIPLDRLTRPPGALRYAPDAWCRQREGHHPAMVAGLWRFGEPRLAAVHRTYLDPSTEPVGKAALDGPRSILGPWKGAIIPIQRGETGRRWRDLGEGELVAFGEGIEEALSVALVEPEWRVASVGFVGNFAHIELPVWCHVVLAGNNDPAGSQAAAELEKGADALERRGHVVRIARPPIAFKDWNDFLTGKRRER